MDEINLEARVRELESEIHNLEKDLIHDPLTGLKTRAFFEEELEVYLNAISQSDQGKRKEWFGFKNLSIILFDIDHFKKVNDTYGHEAGDKVLKKVAEVIMDGLRAGDTPARWGGEEMVISLLGANEKDAWIKAERIRSNISLIAFPEYPDLKITMSAGVATSEKGMEIPELVRRADEALYKAKNAGRDRSVSYSEISNG